MTSSHSMIEPIVKRNFGDTFQCQSGKISINTIIKTLVNSTNTNILVNSINPDPIKDSGPHE